MRQFIRLWLIFICAFTLSGCCFNCFTSHKKPDLTCELWQKKIITNTKLWTQNADSWFFNGLPNQTERMMRCASPASAITILSVRVGNFTNIVLNGNFQVQLVGGQERSTVYLVGPNAETQQAQVRVNGNVLTIAATNPQANLCHVIVRIGVCQLTNLTNQGSGTVYGRDIFSRNLSVFASGSGHILLQGKMNVCQVTQLGSGTITLLGAWTPMLTLMVNGPGNVNICGRVGVQKIVHNGDGCINIIGADSRCLTILATGSGVTAITGFANLQQVIASGHSRVYVYWVNAAQTLVEARDNARIGLAGTTKNLRVTLRGAARFGGKCLLSQEGYVRTYKTSHANVNASQSMFAMAAESSSIYFFGPPKVLSSNATEAGLIIPMHEIEAVTHLPIADQDAWAYVPALKL